ncbi:MAG: hypothetical protein HND44_01060 [Chloroflexi bacterium]|nr:ATP-binding protein [Ardenticatenaceae bacterium]MBL1127089.1 hypothetical protein [Chloroflexota bacterium]NOG33150.1 hypothetical protein [Chloroflexota bacterium]GIK54944.1 MAG: hypothetical protein BroJett015_06070 [Chloroflexota bacterium]
MTHQSITVTSHVARDFLQNAVYFNTLPKVIWEYVSNSLDNAKDDTPVTVSVDLLPTKPKTLQIADNGIGMSRKALLQFFQMHGENVQRKKGKRVRGRFGTGKSAAFGVANTLVIDTVQNGIRNVVELTRDAIENASHGGAFPVEELVNNEVVDREDGTIVQITNFINPRFNFEQTITYIERHLGRYKSRATVIINGHNCKFREPASIRSFSFTPPPDVTKRISEIELLIKVAPTPLEKEFNGIDILSYGIWHETTLAGIENKDLANRIFGEVDVPKLEDYEGAIPAFDNTRNNQLNRSNPLVIVLLGWIASEVENVRKILVEEERERKRGEQFKRLEERAKEIESILNEDFLTILDQYELARKVSARKSTKLSTGPGEDGEVLPEDGDEISKWQVAGHPHGKGIKGSQPPGEGATPRPGGPSLIVGTQKGSPKEITETGDTSKNNKKRRGIFTIEWTEGSPDDNRSEYKKDTRTIYINLSHPQVSSALKASGGVVDSRQFKEIVYEIAVVEYALAVQYERAESEEVDPFDALFEVGSIIDRVTRKISLLLSTPSSPKNP